MCASKEKMSVKRYYVRDSVVPFEEDMFHEFKGHRNICVEQQPPWTKETPTERASRKAVSRVINSFLNTGKGGVVYLGILDSGRVKGLSLTQYQKDHVYESVKDTVSRYKPPVKEHRYKVSFIPVINRDCSEEEIRTQCLYNDSDHHGDSYRGRGHMIRSHNFCWCDKDAVAQVNCGVFAGDYVIEISVKHWDPNDARNEPDACGRIVKLHPFHEDEEGNVHFRRQASLIQYSMSEMAQLSRHDVQDKCEEEKRRLRRKIQDLENSKIDSND